MSQDYDDGKSWEWTKWRIGVPLALASLWIGIRIVENIFSKSLWTTERGFHLLMAFVLLILVPLTWRAILN